MYKNKFRSFFDKVIYQTDNWVTNGHFIFDKAILTKGQKKVLDDFPYDENVIQKAIDIINTYKDTVIDPTKEFRPVFLYKGSDIEIVYDDHISLSLDHKYYNFFVNNRKCKIFKGNGENKPALIYKNNNLVGVLMPIRFNKTSFFNNAIPYEEYLQEQHTRQKSKTKAEKMKRKCLYISNNKAVIRNKSLKNVGKLTKNKQYNNLYVDMKPDKNGFVQIYIDVDIVCIYTGSKAKQDRLIEDASYYFDKFSNITFSTYRDGIYEALDKGYWVNIAEVKLMELAGEPEEFIEQLIQHRERIKKTKRTATPTKKTAKTKKRKKIR